MEAYYSRQEMLNAYRDIYERLKEEAGIGFELKNMRQKTLASNLWGTTRATRTTIGPTALPAVLMLALNILLSGRASRR